jgi:hypothetical protein
MTQVSQITLDNQGFPSFRSNLNSTLNAFNTSQSGTSRPASAVAGTLWLDTTSATTPTLKYYDGADDISLATLDHTANTVNWLDNSVSFDIVNDVTPQLGADLDVNGNAIVSTTDGNIAITPNGTGKVIIDGISHPTADGTNGQALTTDGSGVLSFTTVAVSFSSVGEDILPSTTDTYDLGSTTKVWANIYTGDLNLSNEAKSEGNAVDGTKGNWTIQEGSDDLFILNNKSGKKYKFKLEEI